MVTTSTNVITAQIAIHSSPHQKVRESHEKCESRKVPRTSSRLAMPRMIAITASSHARERGQRVQQVQDLREALVVVEVSRGGGNGSGAHGALLSFVLPGIRRLRGTARR